MTRFPIVRPLAAAALLLLAASGCRRGQGTAAPPEFAQGPAGAPAAAFPAPSRPVAGIVTDTWSSEDARDRAGEADTVMALLGIRPGMRVADVGAGSGYYAVRLARRVGPQGRVIAQDIVPRYLRELRERLRREGVPHVTLALGEPHDPRLERESADLAMLVHMYHEVEQPYAFLHNLRPALRPGGRVAVVDLDRPTGRHGTPPALLRCEMEAVGYRQAAFHPLPEGSGYLAVFAPEGATPEPKAVKACAAP